ncbi:hypothetical protein [Streptomyces litchfieldiae]|uniref:Uncharacterized protein n=1 Tax=Streptomyces litchfieldiae TaxID=3075543 RepID=A0ABU2MJF0_9ACTN|nr:hypothetical protein [Streptomyces sp. DSM 44938]MDT0341562.1 hypothetical protein [Streptomyces sp. DSM 44938]
MLALGLLAGLTGYLLGALLTARVAYGVQRASLIEQEELWHAGQDPVESFEVNDRSSAVTGAFLFGLAWPVTVPASCVRRCATFVITARPPTTRQDRERRAQHLRQRIHALEESLLEDSLDAPLEE